MKKTIVPIVLAVSLVILIAGASVLYSRYGDSFGGGQLIVPSAGDAVTTTETEGTTADTTIALEGGSTVTVPDRLETTTTKKNSGQPTKTVTTTATTTGASAAIAPSSSVKTATATTQKATQTTVTRKPMPTTTVTTTRVTTTQTKPPRTEKQAPNFTVYDENGKAVKLSDYSGKPIVLNFWASWCPPCKREMPDFQKKYEQYGDEVQFLMVNLTVGSETVKTAKAFVEKNGYTFPVLYDRQQSAVYAYDIYSIPATFFIDAQGYIMGQATGAINEATLQQGIDRIK